AQAETPGVAKNRDRATLTLLDFVCLLDQGLELAAAHVRKGKKIISPEDTVENFLHRLTLRHMCTVGRIVGWNKYVVRLQKSDVGALGVKGLGVRHHRAF